MSNAIFRELVASRIPLISARIEGEVQVQELLSEIFPERAFMPVSGFDLSGIAGEGVVLYLTRYEDSLLESVEPDKLWMKLLTEKRTLVLVNFPDSLPQQRAQAWGNFYSFAGRLLPPDSYIAGMLQSDVEASDVVPVLRGLTTKQIAEVLMICQQNGGVTPRAVRRVRGRILTTPLGVELLSLHSDFYIPDPRLVELVESMEGFIGGAHAPVLVPKGVLLSGTPGTGKTEAARYIAAGVELPLYRLELGAALSKFHGESERQLREALYFLNENSPCVVLFDEVEKVLRVTTSGDEGSSISNRMLSMLLWWLEEKPAGIYVVMTTNNVSEIPEELVREGRIDQELHLTSFGMKHIAVEFLLALDSGLLAPWGVPPITIEIAETLVGQVPTAEWVPAKLKEKLLEHARKVIRAQQLVFDGAQYAPKP